MASAHKQPPRTETRPIDMKRNASDLDNRQRSQYEGFPAKYTGPYPDPRSNEPQPQPRPFEVRTADPRAREDPRFNARPPEGRPEAEIRGGEPRDPRDFKQYEARPMAREDPRFPRQMDPRDFRDPRENKDPRDQRPPEGRGYPRQEYDQARFEGRPIDPRIEGRPPMDYQAYEGRPIDPRIDPRLDARMDPRHFERNPIVERPPYGDYPQGRPGEIRGFDPRSDPRMDPRGDPRIDPRGEHRPDPRIDFKDPRVDPRMQPRGDPRFDPRMIDRPFDVRQMRDPLQGRPLMDRFYDDRSHPARFQPPPFDHRFESRYRDHRYGLEGRPIDPRFEGRHPLDFDPRFENRSMDPRLEGRVDARYIHPQEKPQDVPPERNFGQGYPQGRPQEIRTIFPRNEADNRPPPQEVRPEPQREIPQRPTEYYKASQQGYYPANYNLDPALRTRPDDRRYDRPFSGSLERQDDWHRRSFDFRQAPMSPQHGDRYLGSPRDKFYQQGPLGYQAERPPTMPQRIQSRMNERTGTDFRVNHPRA